MKKMLFHVCLLVISVGVSEAIASHPSNTVTINAVPTAASPNGDEAVFDVVIDYGNNVQVTVEFHVTSNSISTPGGGPIPALDNVPFFAPPITGGSWGPEPEPPLDPGGPGFVIQGYKPPSELTSALVAATVLKPDDAGVQNAGVGIALAALTCIGIHFGMPFVHRKVCGDQGVKFSTPGYCGYLSAVECYNNPPPPPPEPPPSNPNGQGSGWAGGTSANWSPPQSWGWEIPGGGTVTIRDVEDADD